MAVLGLEHNTVNECSVCEKPKLRTAEFTVNKIFMLGSTKKIDGNNAAIFNLNSRAARKFSTNSIRITIEFFMTA